MSQALRQQLAMLYGLEQDDHRINLVLNQTIEDMVLMVAAGREVLAKMVPGMSLEEMLDKVTAGNRVMDEMDSITKTQEAAMGHRREIGESRRDVLHDMASPITLVDNMWVFLLDPIESDRFVGSIPPDARKILLSALEALSENK